MYKNRFENDLDALENGLTALRIVAGRFKLEIATEEWNKFVTPTIHRLFLHDLCGIAEKLRFRVRIAEVTFSELINDATFPCIIELRANSFLVLAKRCPRLLRKKFYCEDPQIGKLKLTAAGLFSLLSHSINEQKKIQVLFIEPTFEFWSPNDPKVKKLKWGLVLNYFSNDKVNIAKVIISLLITSMLQLIFPFLMQSIVDVGISTLDLNYITVVLTAQLMLVFSQAINDFVRSHLLLHISTRVNLSILSDFLIKLTRLPLSFFDSNQTGDIMQRIQDNREIQQFLTGPALNTMFSLLSFVVFGIVLALYKAKLFLIFIFAIILYFFWLRLFLPARRRINYKIFNISAKENDTTLELVHGMREMRLHNFEQAKRWQWEGVQAEIFKLNIKGLTLSQAQQAGAIIINHGKDFILTFLVAKLVIDGELTFGAMLAIQYVIGQLTGPVEQFNTFVQDFQDAKICLERLNEIHQMEDEEKLSVKYSSISQKNQNIKVQGLSFAYRNGDNTHILNDINLTIEQGSVTAIVGPSGSGKSTLIKLLLKFYPSYSGKIEVGGTDFANISPASWRSNCGTVLQDGYIFGDSIARNIAIGFTTYDQEKLFEACRIANILEFIEALPEKFDTLLSAQGVGISQGQKQRILIARAIYKNPQFLFFDEPTNSLDAITEKTIVENLKDFFSMKTVVIVAHRLTTVKNADKIIVLHEGVIVEQGNHEELIALQGEYYKLVKNQLQQDEI
jgi:ATP-binding cassette, subfamily B, bacterial